MIFDRGYRKVVMVIITGKDKVARDCSRGVSMIY